ncbi:MULTISPECIES: hypothetical protein [unclassified Streptomyces]
MPQQACTRVPDKVPGDPPEHPRGLAVGHDAQSRSSQSDTGGDH